MSTSNDCFDLGATAATEQATETRRVVEKHKVSKKMKENFREKENLKRVLWGGQAHVKA